MFLLFTLINYNHKQVFQLIHACCLIELILLNLCEIYQESKSKENQHPYFTRTQYIFFHPYNLYFLNIENIHFKTIL